MNTFEAVSCRGKRKMIFRVAMRQAQKMRRLQESKITHYRCDLCEYWHVGNRPEHDR